MDDATYKDVSGKATMTSGRNCKSNWTFSNTGKTFQKINSQLLN